MRILPSLSCLTTSSITSSGWKPRRKFERCLEELGYQEEEVDDEPRDIRSLQLKTGYSRAAFSHAFANSPCYQPAFIHVYMVVFVIKALPKRDSGIRPKNPLDRIATKIPVNCSNYSRCPTIR